MAWRGDLGDTRSANDLAVFTRMAPERLCLGCGLRVDEPFAPLATGERKKLFYAAQKLLMFVLHEVCAQTFSQEEAALKAALMPLIANRDGHFRAGRHTHAFGLHLSMRLANGFDARHCI